MLDGLEELKRTHDGETICLVAHGISARILILEALGLGLERLWSLQVVVDRHLGARVPPGLDGAAPHEHARPPRERAGDAVGVRPVRGRAAADAAPQGRQDLPARRGGEKARGGGAPPRRLPALGLSRARDVGVRVLRRALPGHGSRPAGADVQDGGPRERAAARAARGHHAADRAHRGDADAGRRQAAPPRLRHQRLPLRRAARGPLPRVLPGGRGAGRAPPPGRRRRDDRDDRGGVPRARPRALPDRRRPGRLLPRHPRGRRRRRGHRARAAPGAGPQGPELARAPRR